MKNILNETVIRKIVEESLAYTLMEGIDLKSSMGSKGPLTESELQKPQELMKSTYDLYDKVMASGKKVNIDKVFKDDIGYNIWKNYVTSMLGSFTMRNIGDYDDDGDTIQEPILNGFKPQDKDKQYPKYARGFFGWLHDVRKGKLPMLASKGRYPIMAYQLGDNYLFGHWIHGYFVAAYIAVSGNMGLLKLLMSLAQYDNVIFAVTLDMAAQLSKLGFFTDNDIHSVKYHGGMVDKKLFATSKRALTMALNMHSLASLRDPMQILTMFTNKRP